MTRYTRLLIALVVVGLLAGPVAAEPGEADRLLKQGFPEKDYTGSPIKVIIPGHRCVLAASAWTFDADGGATVKDVAVVRVTVVDDREIVEVAAGTSARLTFDPPVKKAEEFGKSKLVTIETSAGRVIRLSPK